LKNPKFGIIAVDYEGHVPRDGMIAGIKSIADQAYKNFEIIICHDGPKAKPYAEEIDFESLGVKTHTINTEYNMGCYGHYSRDLAMKYAYENTDCDYYIQFNIDNKFVPNAFELIKNKIEETGSEIIIFGIWHHKNGSFLSGVPPVVCGIDAMQLVGHKEMWKKFDFWYDKSDLSDGYIYQRICSEVPWVNIPENLGDNF
jgi:hypothetical protein